MPYTITFSLPALLALLTPNTVTIATGYTNYMVILDNERFQMSHSLRFQEDFIGSSQDFTDPSEYC